MIHYISQHGNKWQREWLLERGFHRFKRGSLPALPIYFQNEDRITGLMFVLNIAMLCIYPNGVCGKARSQAFATISGWSLRRQSKAKNQSPICRANASGFLSPYSLFSS